LIGGTREQWTPKLNYEMFEDCAELIKNAEESNDVVEYIIETNFSKLNDRK
jgi:hypothetical protein